jgi:hypothetical protein
MKREHLAKGRWEDHIKIGLKYVSVWSGLVLLCMGSGRPSDARQGAEFPVKLRG